MIKLVCVILFLLLTPVFAAPRHIVLDPGGLMFERYMDWRKVQASGQTIVLDGICLSGCVIFTSLIPPDRVCITPRAIVGVHSASDAEGKFVKEGTRLYWLMLSEPIREAARNQGWRGDTSHPEFVYIPYTVLSNIYRTCSDAELDEVYRPKPPG